MLGDGYGVFRRHHLVQNFRVFQYVFEEFSAEIFLVAYARFTTVTPRI